jgi:hypothetical protein
MFNLEKEIADWRSHMVQAGIGRPEVLDELESHLRSEIERHLAAGWDPQRAFKTAVRQMGDARTIKSEFERAEECQLPEMQKLLWVACIGFAALVCLLSSYVFLTSELGWAKAVFGLGAVSLAILGISWSKRGLGRMTPFTPDDSCSPSTCRSLELARGEASQLHHDFVGTEHVLLGLLEHERVSQALRTAGLDRALLRREILRLVGPASMHQTSGNVPYTPRVTRAMRLAMREAKISNASQVGPEHVLLGLIREGSGVASVALNNLGLNLHNARKLVRKFE